MKTRWLIVALAVAGLFAAQGLLAEDKEKAKKLGKEVMCPVSNKPAKLASAAKFMGADVYFCCNGCPKAFAKDSAKFALKASHQLLQTGNAVQVGCPLSGGKCKKETAFDVGGGVKVAFCCNNCPKKVKAVSGDDRLKILFAKFDKGFTTQTMCPVSNKPINPTAVTTYKEKKVYFCCPGCPGAFKKDPAKYVAKLPQFAKKG